MAPGIVHFLGSGLCELTSSYSTAVKETLVSDLDKLLKHKWGGGFAISETILCFLQVL